MCSCGAKCWIVLAELVDEYGECVGEISVIDETSDGQDYYWVHACIKHKKTYWKIH